MSSKYQTTSLEAVINSEGELLTTVLVFVPLMFELSIRYGMRAGVLAVIALGVLYGLSSLIRLKGTLERRRSVLVMIVIYFIGFGAMAWLLGNQLSGWLFVGVILCAIVSYVFSWKGFYISLFVYEAIIVGSFLGRNEAGLDWQQDSQLFSYVALSTLVSMFVATIIDLTRKEIRTVQDANERLKLEHQRLQSLINNIGDAVIATNERGEIQNYNGAALELLNTNLSLQGRRLDDVWNLQDGSGKHIKLLEESTRTMRRSDLVIQYAPNDKANVYANVTPIKIGYGQNAQKGFTLILRDVTKEKSLDQERDEFISVVSHELRTPVTITEGKIGNAQFLLAKPKSSKAQLGASLKEAHDQVVFLANMINDLSTLSRAERDDIKMDLEPIDPAELATALVNSYQVEAKQNKLFLSLHLPVKPLKPIITNRLYLQEILQNFVTNALKYTRDGGITFSVSAKSRDMIEFRVSDTGIGISTSDQKRLFEKFFRSEDFRTRESSGTGLGLYVTIKLAHKLQAKIGVKSRLNRGSTFSLSVPSLPQSARERRQSHFGA